MTPRDALLAAVRGRPADEPVTVAAGWIQQLLATLDAGVAIDLSAVRVAELLGRDPVTIGTWCRSGFFPGAYKLRGRQWRIPRPALEQFQRTEAER